MTGDFGDQICRGKLYHVGVAGLPGFGGFTKALNAKAQRREGRLLAAGYVDARLGQAHLDF
jgi:hypothetical protein